MRSSHAAIVAALIAAGQGAFPETPHRIRAPKPDVGLIPTPLSGTLTTKAVNHVSQAKRRKYQRQNWKRADGKPNTRR